MRQLLRALALLAPLLALVTLLAPASKAAQVEVSRTQPSPDAAEPEERRQDAPQAEGERRPGTEERPGGFREFWNSKFLPGQDITVGNVVSAFLLLVAGFVFSRRVARLVRAAVLARVRFAAGAAAAVESILFYLLLLIVFYVALGVAGVPLTAFTLLGGAAAIGIGFGSQKLVADFIAGLILLLERPIREGDLIQVVDLYGNVVRVGARSTLVRTGDNVEIFVPNSLFLEERIYNLTLTDSRMRTRVSVKVARGSPTEEVARLIRRAVEENERVHATPEPIVLLTDLGDDALVFEVHFWIDVRTWMSRRLTESDVRFRIDALFRESGITMAFPQRDVHLDTVRPLDVRIVQPAESPGASS